MHIFELLFLISGLSAGCWLLRLNDRRLFGLISGSSFSLRSLGELGADEDLLPRFERLDLSFSGSCSWDLLMEDSLVVRGFSSVTTSGSEVNSELPETIRYWF